MLDLLQDPAPNKWYDQNPVWQVMGAGVFPDVVLVRVTDHIGPLPPGPHAMH